MTMVATALPARLVSARASDMKRSTPISNASPATGSECVAAKVAANVTNPPPVTAAAPFDVSSSTPRMPSCCANVRGVSVACAMKTAAIVR